MHGVPTMYSAAHARRRTFDPARFRVAAHRHHCRRGRCRRSWCGAFGAGATCSSPTGSPRPAPTVTITRFTDAADKRLTTVGRPLPGVEIKAVDVVTGALHGPEAVGEIAVRGPNVMQGYARMPAETARSFSPEGFFLTGDLGIIDEEGYVRIVGRRRETIVRGGFQHLSARSRGSAPRASRSGRRLRDRYPPRHSGRAGLRVHRSRRRRGHHGRASSRTFARDTMADYKVPDLVRFFDAFPMTGSGKVKRRELERMVALDHTHAHDR